MVMANTASSHTIDNVAHSPLVLKPDSDISHQEYKQNEKENNYSTSQCTHNTLPDVHFRTGGISR